MAERTYQRELLAFSDLMAALRERNFVIGVDEHLRVQRLLETFGPDVPPDRLKTILCPVLARNRRQQQVFYRVFDAFWPPQPNAAVPDTAAAEPAQAAVPRRLTRVRRWAVAAAAAVVVVLIAGFWSSGRFRPMPVAPPVTPSNPEPARVQPPAAPVVPVQRQPRRIQKPRPGWVVVHRTELAAATALLPVVWFGVWQWSRKRRRYAALAAARDLAPPYTWPLRVDVAPPRIYRSQRFVAAARLLRRRVQATRARSLDLNATVRETVRAGGFPIFRFQRRTRPAEYLCLIKRASPADHRAQLFLELAHSLREEGVTVEAFFYDGDPRLCMHPGTGLPHTLPQLAHRFWAARLLIFGDASDLLHPVTGEPETWTELVARFDAAALLTLDPPSPHNRLYSALPRLHVLPATIAGLELLANLFSGPASVPADSSGAFAELGGAPSPAQLDDVAALADYCGPGDFTWLCACAVYPELEWRLTLYLGAVAATEPPLVIEANLLRLVRLPWFTEGHIPDAMRRRLLANLSPEQVRNIQAAVVRLLEASPAPEQSYAEAGRRLEIAVFRARDRGRPRRSFRERLRALRFLPPGHIVHDATLLRFLDARGRAAFTLPDWFRRIVFVGGIRSFGLSNVAGLLIAVMLTSSLAAGAAWLRRVTDVRTLVARGTVVDEQRRPITGAQVRLESSDEIWQDVTTGDDGGFNLTLAHTGEPRIQGLFSARGFRELITELDYAASSAPVIVLRSSIAPGPAVRAFTANRQTIRAGETVTLAWDVPDAITVVVQPAIGSFGSVASTPVRPAQSTTYTLVARNAAGGTTTASVTVTVTSDGAKDYIVGGRVEDETGKPVRATVIAEPEGAPPEGIRYAAALGSFSLTLPTPSGVTLIAVSGNRYSQPVYVPLGKNKLPVRIIMPSGAKPPDGRRRVAVRVVDEQGRARPGCTIRVDGKELQGDEIELSLGKHTFEAVCPGYAMQRRITDIGNTDTTVTVTAPYGRPGIPTGDIPVNVSVIDESGKPVAGCKVDIYLSRPQGWARADSAVTGIKGYFQTALDAHPYTVLIWCKEAAATGFIRVQSGGNNSFTLTALKDGKAVLPGTNADGAQQKVLQTGHIRGIVTFRNRRQPGCSVEIRDRSGQTSVTNSDGLGTFEFMEVAAGAIEVSASCASGMGTMKLTLQSGEFREATVVIGQDALPEP